MKGYAGVVKVVSLDLGAAPCLLTIFGDDP